MTSPSREQQRDRVDNAQIGRMYRNESFGTTHTSYNNDKIKTTQYSVLLKLVAQSDFGIWLAHKENPKINLACA